MIPHTVYTDNSYLRYRQLQQDTDEFWQRRGERSRFVSASEVPIICNQGWSPRKDLEELLQCKRTGVRPPVSDFVKAAQDHGKRFEQFARAWFEKEFAVRVQQTGLWVHPVDQRISASPDGLIMSSAGHIPVEFKCPYRAASPIKPQRVHKDSLQLQTTIQCTGAAYGLLVYYWNDDLTEVYFIENNPSHWLQIVAHVDWFLSLVNDSTAALIVDYSLNRRRYAELVQQYFIAARQTDSGASLLQERLTAAGKRRRHSGEEGEAGGATACASPKRAARERDEEGIDSDSDVSTQAPQD